jgi:hypothetical protein
MGAKQSHTMVVFVIPFVVAVISWFWDLNHNSKAVAAIKWISASGAFGWFLTHAAWLPFSRHQEQQRTIDEQRNAFATEQRRLEAEIQRLADDHTLLTITWRPNPPCSDGNRCRVEVHNTHRFHASQNVRVQLIAMDPIPRSLRNPVFPINLPRVDEGERTVNPDSNGYFELFFLRVNDETVRRQPSQIPWALRSTSWRRACHSGVFR